MGPGVNCLHIPACRLIVDSGKLAQCYQLYQARSRAGRGGRVMLVLGLLWRFQAVECILCPFSLPGSKQFGGVLCAAGVHWGLGLGGGGCWISLFSVSRHLH